MIKCNFSMGWQLQLFKMAKRQASLLNLFRVASTTKKARLSLDEGHSNDYFKEGRKNH